MLDARCVTCHDGTQSGVTDLRRKPPEEIHKGRKVHGSGKFSPAYAALRRFVRSPTLESDLHLLPPLEFHADTTRLVQLLRSGHYVVQLTEDDWERVNTWIDLHTPYWGSWTELAGDKRVEASRKLRNQYLRDYAQRSDDPEQAAAQPAAPSKTPKTTPVPAPPNPRPDIKWAFDAKEAKARQGSAPPKGETRKTLNLGGGVSLALTWIPPGTFTMTGTPDAKPVQAVIQAPYWMGETEVTNRQFARFDASHDSRLEHGDFLQFSSKERGFALNLPDQPVARVSWNRAVDFCRWLSKTTGHKVTLPTEMQWEWACRAGAASPLWFGDANADFTQYANLADADFQTVGTYGWQLPSGAIPPWRPARTEVRDGFRVSSPVGTFQANPWGLMDMHGNVAEWTLGKSGARRIVRGGSWYDRPRYARADSRVAYHAFQPVFDVGFRVVVETTQR